MQSGRLKDHRYYRAAFRLESRRDDVTTRGSHGKTGSYDNVYSSAPIWNTRHFAKIRPRARLIRRSLAKRQNATVTKADAYQRVSRQKRCGKAELVVVNLPEADAARPCGLAWLENSGGMPTSSGGRSVGHPGVDVALVALSEHAATTHAPPLERH